ncbi:MAG: family oxidoreductase [Bacteroidetes bacterium]|jgi:UDP-N-acetylglucosamine 4-epimerase|nr:family oxidoreductase [Bacteroidota bacterium]
MYDTPFHTKDISKFSFLVTGGAGFIGSHIVEYLLKQGAGKVTVLDDLSTGSIENVHIFEKHPQYRFIRGDIRNPDDCKKACEGIDYVTHQGALGSVPRSIENPLATHSVNATGFINMLVAARDAKVKRVVYASSSSVYGDLNESPKTEERIGKPLSPYAVSKLVNEQYAAIFASTYAMQITGLRYFNIFGPRQNPNGAYAAAIPLFIQSVLSNKPVYINGSGEQSRDFTFVENAVQANIKALLTDEPSAINKVFNIACGDSISVNEMFDKIRTQLHSGVKAIYREERFGDVKNSKANISAARQEIGYVPVKSFDEGLTETIAYYKEIQ